MREKSVLSHDETDFLFHGILSIMHYALCIMHYMLCIIHSM